MGTGKGVIALATASYLFKRGEIDAMLVVAPSGVHRNWISDEIPTHLPEDVLAQTRCFYFDSSKANTITHKFEAKAILNHKGFSVLAISYDGFMTAKGKTLAWNFLKSKKVLYILDEAHFIKTPSAKRTRAIVASAKYAPYRRALTGTPVAQYPFDVYSQIKFIDENFWKGVDLDGFAAFKSHFGLWFTRWQAKKQRGFDPGYDQLLGYRNLDELKVLITAVSDRVAKDVLGLPEKIYQKRYFDMTPKQARAYRQLTEELLVELDGECVLTAELAIVRLLRLQQITCGYIQHDVDEPVRPIDTKNPRLDCLEDICSGLSHPTIIWARFREDIRQICKRLGDSAVPYFGDLTDDEAEANKNKYLNGEAQYFVATPSKGGTGLTLVNTKTVIYYSNSFKLNERLQSEDRAHRIGQKDSVNYVDIVCPDTVDVKITDALRKNFNIASQLTGDTLREWI
jgi:SNF2 family DNA or RNA helicase